MPDAQGYLTAEECAELKVIRRRAEAGDDAAQKELKEWTKRRRQVYKKHEKERPGGRPRPVPSGEAEYQRVQKRIERASAVRPILPRPMNPSYGDHGVEHDPSIDFNSEFVYNSSIDHASQPVQNPSHDYDPDFVHDSSIDYASQPVQDPSMNHDLNFLYDHSIDFDPEFVYDSGIDHVSQSSQDPSNHYDPDFVHEAGMDFDPEFVYDPNMDYAPEALEPAAPQRPPSLQDPVDSANEIPVPNARPKKRRRVASQGAVESVARTEESARSESIPIPDARTSFERPSPPLLDNEELVYVNSRVYRVLRGSRIKVSSLTFFAERARTAADVRRLSQTRLPKPNIYGPWRHGWGEGRQG